MTEDEKQVNKFLEFLEEFIEAKVRTMNTPDIEDELVLSKARNIMKKFLLGQKV